MNKLEEIKSLIKRLNEASEAYYKNDIEIMSNFEYDKLYDQLSKLEDETGVVFANSPTVRVGYETVEQLPKEAHEKRMLSLDKTKNIEELREWLGDKKGLLSWKIDGLTVVLTYRDGILAKAVTRGNGEVGEVVTGNAKTFQNVPQKIPFLGEIVVRGEAFIKYSDFEEINKNIPETEAKYKNPRNLCSGSVRQLNSEVTAKRKVNFMCFSLEKVSDIENLLSEQENQWKNSKKNQLEWLKTQGFETVEYKDVTRDNIEFAVKDFGEKISKFDIPSDGLVLIYDDISYGESLGNTAKFPRNSIAFKWQDEIRETVLKEIIWSPSRTGLVNPIASFEPVELEGTMVARASVHNVSILKELNLKKGDHIMVYKANMIIPQIEENLSKTDKDIDLPKACPACREELQLKSDLGVETLVCNNELCPAKRIKTFSLFVSRDAMNIENLSESTIEKFISCGFIRELPDIFKLADHKEEIIKMDGFGEKSFKNIINAIEKAKKTTVPRLLYGLGIGGIGVSNGKVIARSFDYSWNRIKEATKDELLSIDGIGEIMANSFIEFFENEKNSKVIEELEKYIEFVQMKSSNSSIKLANKTFVITGNVNIFKNRNQLKEVIENNGGKVASSISKNTDYLINNNVESSSSKNKKAKELGILIISEEDFVKILDE